MITRVSDVAGVALAAGFGERLRPITAVVPKPLCPVGNRPLLDWALDGLSAAADRMAVNVHHHATQIVDYVGDRAHISFESERPLGTAGALSSLRDWIDGTPVLVQSADAWHQSRLADLLDGWDQERTRLWVVRTRENPDFDDFFYVGAALIPWRHVSQLPAEGSLLTDIWPAMVASGEVAMRVREEAWIDCGTPRGLYEANMKWSGGTNVIAPDAVVEGHLKSSVVLPGSSVRAHERLERIIRFGDDVTLGPF